MLNAAGRYMPGMLAGFSGPRMPSLVPSQEEVSMLRFHIGQKLVSRHSKTLTAEVVTVEDGGHRATIQKYDGGKRGSQETLGIEEARRDWIEA
jgi:hypothetical protein